MKRRFKKKKQKPSKAYLLLPVFLVLLVALLISFNLNIRNERQEIKVHLDDLQKNYEALSASLYQEDEEEVVDIEERIEMIAREQLLLKKEGERVIIIARDEDDFHEEGEEVYIQKDDKEKEKNIPERVVDFFQNIFN